jgi:hypothetical protein
MKVHYFTTTEVRDIGIANCWVNCAHKTRRSLMRHLEKCYKDGLAVKILVRISYGEHHFYGRAEI